MLETRNDSVFYPTACFVSTQVTEAGYCLKNCLKPNYTVLFVSHKVLRMKGNRKSELLTKSTLPEEAGHSFFNSMSGLEEDQLKYFVLFLE